MLTDNERHLLDSMLDHEFEGVEALRGQLDAVRVIPSCDCGCGSLGFVFNDTAPLERSPARSPLPVEGVVLDGDGREIGGILVLLRDGYLDDLDVYSYAQAPLALPDAGHVRWR